MDSFVVSHRLCTGETGAAALVATNEWLLARVCPHMRGTVVRVAEGQIANFADNAVFHVWRNLLGPGLHGQPHSVIRQA